MKKTVVLSMLIAMCSAAAFAQEEKPVEPIKGERHLFSVHILYPLSTGKSKDDFSYANFSLLYGHIGEVKGIDLSHTSSFIRRDMTGLQGSGAFAYTGGNLYGAAISGLGHYSENNLSGLQGSGIFNYTGGELKGFQAAGIVNIAGSGMKGMQVAGITNVAGALRGLQVSTVNVAGDTKGMQIGLVNVAGDISGMQLGLVNVSKTMNGVPLGLVNISGNGGIEIAAWGSNLTAANMGVRFRANYVYTMIAFSGLNMERSDEKEKSAAGAFYLGVRVPVSGMYFDVDAGFVNLDNGKLFKDDDSVDQKAFQGRAVAGLHITDSLSVFAGGGVSYIIDEGENIADGSCKPLYLGGVAWGF